MDVARAISSPTRSSILRSTPGIGDCTQSDVAAWTEARLVKSALIRMIDCACLYRAKSPSPREPVGKRTNFALFNNQSGFLFGPAIIAAPSHGKPLRMLVDPLRD